MDCIILIRKALINKNVVFVKNDISFLNITASENSYAIIG